MILDFLPMLGTPYFTNSGSCLFDFTNFVNDLIIAEDVANSNTNGKNEWITPRKQYHINVILLVSENKQWAQYPCGFFVLFGCSVKNLIIFFI